MVTFKLEAESEALRVLQKLTQVAIPKKVTREVARDLQRDARERYWQTWGPRGARKPHNVYTAVKEAAFGKVQRGLLTGSTVNAIQGSYGTNVAGAGFGKYSWPTGSGRASFRAQDVIDILSEMGRFEGTMMSRPVYFGTGKITWTSNGLRIMWPRSVRNIGVGVNVYKGDYGDLRLGFIKKGFEDVYIPPEPFDTKKYGKGKRGKDFFALTKERIRDVTFQIETYIDRVIFGERPVAREAPATGGEEAESWGTGVSAEELADLGRGEGGEAGYMGYTSSQAEWASTKAERSDALGSLEKELRRMGASEAEIKDNISWYKKVMRGES